METIKRHLPLLLILTMCLMFIPWLGETLFNTKGEPREAIVAYSMIESGNWVLPVSYGSDIPYKPPFLAWCIAVVSMLLGGVSEFASRLPSTLAVMMMVVWTFIYFRRTTASANLALLTALISITNFEVWRSAWACRVDMVLTACIVCAIYSLDTHFALLKNATVTRSKKLWPWIVAVILMTCAVLTKGPVGMILPCLVIGCVRVIKGDRFFPLLGKLAATGILACVVPALWYIAAYQHGGEEFYQLAMEENFGRFLGKMSYASHEKGMWYNAVTLITGMLPYTLLALLSLIVVKWRKPQDKLKEWLADKWQKIRNMDQATLLSLVSAVVIFVFYCIPKSKRSVYIMPMYPFVCYFMARLILWLMSTEKSKILKSFASIISAVAVIAGAATFIVTDGLPSIVAGVIGLTVLFFGIYTLMRLRALTLAKTVRLTMTAIVLIYTAMMSSILPQILNKKSDKTFAEKIEVALPSGEPLYGYSGGTMHRFYTVNYYLGDRMRRFETTKHQEGYLLLSEPYLKEFEQEYPDRYQLTPIIKMDKRSCDSMGVATLYRFTSK